MTQQEQIEYWLSTSVYDMKVAEDLYKNGHFLYVGFLCHQSTEKLLKAYWCKVSEQTPIKIHTLIRLATLTGMWEKMSEEQKNLLGVLEPLNISCRYPDYKSDISKMLNKDRTQILLNNTKALQEWIKTQL